VKFKLYWLDGFVEEIEGDSISDAVSNTGYGGGAMQALDFWSDSPEKDNYVWDPNKKKWVNLDIQAMFKEIQP
jgi:hypothetical protein